eukprot:COSAG01_NODE_3863_length_5621_cov_2.450970_4_plen_87_part_00
MQSATAGAVLSAPQAVAIASPCGGGATTDASCCAAALCCRNLRVVGPDCYAVIAPTPLAVDRGCRCGNVVWTVPGRLRLLAVDWLA